MLRKNLFVFISLLLSSLLYAQDTVCGWIGPISPHGDTGHIEISDLHTQGQHSLNFVVYYVESDTLHEVYTDFCKYFGGIELPDSLKWDIYTDTSFSAVSSAVRLMIVYQDTVWLSVSWAGTSAFWYTFCMNSEDFADGVLVSPDFVYPHFPPHRIDSLRFRVEWYEPENVSIFIDNLRFYYGDIDTLVDGMGEKSGIEEEVLPLGQVLEIFPNPCGNSAIEISYSLRIPSYVRFEVYDIAGSKIMAFTEKGEAEKYRRLMNLKDKRLPSGVYFLHMTTDNISTTRKFILLH